MSDPANAPAKKSLRHGLNIKRVPASVQLLETRLQSADEEIREQAWKGIEKLGAPEEALVEKCEEQLHHENWFVREAGVKALAFCVDPGHGMLAASMVEPHLEHEQPHMRQCAVQCLVDLEDRVRVKTDALKQKRAEQMMQHNRQDIIEAETITKEGEPAERAAEMVAQRLNHEDPKIRQNSLVGLSRILVSQQVSCAPYTSPMCSMVTDPNLSVRNELLRVIARLGPLVVEGASLFAAALGHEEEKMRRSGKRALLELSKTCGAEVAQSITEPLKSDNRITRLAALDCFASLGPLAGPHGPELAGHLEESDPEIRLHTVHAIISAGKSMQPHHSEIKRRIHHENPDISRAAVKTLRGLAPVCGKVARSAFKDLEEEPELKTRMMAVEVIGGAKHNAKHLEEVAKALEDKDWNLRRCAIEALCDLEEHADAIAGEVARRLLHHDPDVRRAAAEALGRMGLHAGEYGHRVEGLLDTEEDEDVKATCAEACEMLYKAGMAHGR